MSNKSIYKIEILNWEKYNANLKKGHKKILLSTGFLSNAKIRSLTPVTRLLYLSCLLVAGESTTSHIEVSHESLVFQSGVKSGSLQSQLDLLQSLQLVRYEKNDFLINRIEENRREKKRNRIHAKSEIEVSNTKDYEMSVQQKPPSESPQKVKNFLAVYCEKFSNRYGSNPEITGKDAGIAKRLCKNLGEDKLNFYLEAYFSMPDSGVIKAKHPLTFFEMKLNEIVVFANTGNFTTQKQAQQADESASNMILLQKIRAGQI